MSSVTLNKKVANFTADSTNDLVFKLADYTGTNLVIYFYPKDSTPGCTLEGQDFRDNYSKFKRNITVVVGVSRDSLKSHESFKEKQGFPFELLSDPDEKLCQQFDVIKEKNMYGKKVMGIERSTFLIDAKGILRKEWRKLKVPDHVDEVLEAVRELNKQQGT
jgi:peroxiredoxin Q/BCP